MGPSTNLPDPLFPCPIVHIVAMLGKIRVLDKLGQMPEFDFGCRMEPTGETALHKMIQYLDKAMKEPTRRCCLVKIKETFQVALGRLINKKPELFVLQDHQGDTPFHSTVRAMLSWKSSNWTGKRLEYFAFCLQSMISTLKSLDSGHFLSCTTKDVLSITNKRGDNFLQMLDTMGLDNSIIGSVYSQLDPCLLKELRQGFVSREEHEPSLEVKKQRLFELIGQLREANHLKKETKEDVVHCDSDSYDLPLSPPSELYGELEESEPVFGHGSETDCEAKHCRNSSVSRENDKNQERNSSRESSLNSPSLDGSITNGQNVPSITDSQQNSESTVEKSQPTTASTLEKENIISVAGAILQSPLPDSEKHRLIVETLQGFERKSSEQDMILLSERKRRLEYIQKTRDEKECALTAAREKKRKLLIEAEKLQQNLIQLELELQTTRQEEQERKEAFLQAEKKCDGYLFQVGECHRALESLKKQSADQVNP